MLASLLFAGVVTLHPGLKPVLYQAFPTNIGYVWYWDDVTKTGAFVGDAGNNAVRVNCVIGCSGGPGSGLTDAQLRATPVPMSISSSVPIAVTGTFWQATQPVSGTVGISNSFLLDATFTGRINTLGQKAMAASTPVVIASDQSALTIATHAVTQSGTWNIGTLTSITNPVAVTGTFFQATQPISAAALPLPTGASTLAEQQTQTTALQLIDNLPLAQASTTSGQVGILTQGAVTTANPSYTNAQTSPLSLAPDGTLRVDNHPNRWTCALDNIAASLTQCQAAPAAGLKLWVTSVIAVSTTSTAATFAIRVGTGSNCGTGTAGLLPGASTSRTYVLPANTAAAFQLSSVSGFGTASAAQAICAIGAATNTLNIVISGYTAP